MATSTGVTFARQTLELTSAAYSPTIHSCAKHIWTGKVIKIYRHNLINFKQAKDKSCLCSLNLNVIL